MTLRVLSGILVPDRKVGTITIHFNPHRVAGDGRGAKMSKVGADGDFAYTPAINVALRQIKADSSHREAWNYKIDDKASSKDSVTVGWSYYEESPIEEISYMIIGDVAENN